MNQKIKVTLDKKILSKVDHKRGLKSREMFLRDLILSSVKIPQRRIRKQCSLERWIVDESEVKSND